MFLRVYVCKRVLEIQSSIFLNTSSRPSANISTASIGRQSGWHHFFFFSFFFLRRKVNRAEQTLAVASVVLLLSAISGKFNGFHPRCLCASSASCAAYWNNSVVCVSLHSTVILLRVLAARADWRGGWHVGVISLLLCGS